ncbi:MAG: imelysin family protein, partial [Bradymonadaceae bacterium]
SRAVNDRLVGFLSERTGALTSAVETFCKGDRTSDELEKARMAWRKLQAPLNQIQAWSFNMSPYRGASFEITAYKVDREPSWGDNIEAVIAGDGTYRRDRNADGDDEPDEPFSDGADPTIDQSFIAEQDYRRNAKGYPAVEYLLFGEKDGTAMGELYKSGDNADRRCDYLSAVDAHAAERFDAYVEAWARDGGDFASRFDSPNSEDMDWTTVQDSIDAMVSQMVFVAKQRISKNLLGGPLGQHTDNVKIPDGVSSPHADASIEQMLATLEGLEKLYSGGGGRSLADYTNFRKAAVHELVKRRIDPETAGGGRRREHRESRGGAVGGRQIDGDNRGRSEDHARRLDDAGGRGQRLIPYGGDAVAPILRRGRRSTNSTAGTP